MASLTSDGLLKTDWDASWFAKPARQTSSAADKLYGTRASTAPARPRLKLDRAVPVIQNSNQSSAGMVLLAKEHPHRVSIHDLAVRARGPQSRVAVVAPCKAPAFVRSFSPCLPLMPLFPSLLCSRRPGLAAALATSAPRQAHVHGAAVPICAPQREARYQRPRRDPPLGTHARLHRPHARGPTGRRALVRTGESLGALVSTAAAQ